MKKQYYPDTHTRAIIVDGWLTGRDTPSGQQHVVQIGGHQTAVGYLEPQVVEESPLAVVAGHRIGSDRYGVRLRAAGERIVFANFRWLSSDTPSLTCSSVDTRM